MFSGFFQSKRVLVTGHTGFKGGCRSLWLKSLGAPSHGISPPPPHRAAGDFQRQCRDTLPETTLSEHDRQQPLLAGRP